MQNANLNSNIPPKTDKGNYKMKANKLKKYEIEVSELRRLITDSWMNEKSELFSKCEDDNRMAQMMLDELDKIRAFDGTLEDCRKMIDANVFLPVHAWAFNFTHMQDLERSLSMNECEEFIRLTMDGECMAKIDIDL
jgi:siderophore synthetase component